MSAFLQQMETTDKSVHGEASVALPLAAISWLRVARILLFCGVRIVFAAFLLVTSIYCLLVWVPFSYFGFIQNPLLDWLPAAVRLHGLVYGVLLVAVSLTLIPDFRRNESRTAAVGFVAINGAAFVCLWRAHSLANLQPDMGSYLWSMLSLFPLVWLATLDLFGRVKWQSTEKESHELAGTILIRTTLAAIIVSLIFAGTSLLRAAMQGNGLTQRIALGGVLSSLCFHLVIFTTIGLVLGLIRWVSRATRWPGVVNALLAGVFAWWILLEILRTMILPTISFEGTQASVFAAVVSFVAVFFVMGLVVRLRDVASRERIGWASSPAWLWVLVLVGLPAAAYGIPVILGLRDWDFVLQKTAVMVLWLIILQMAYWLRFPTGSKTVWIPVSFVLICAIAGFARCAKSTLYNSDPSARWQNVLDNYAGADISFKTAYAVLSEPFDKASNPEFYEFLKQNTNLTRKDVVHPVPVRVVPDLAPTPGVKPNIFIFVIDSLRRDYVSPYNPAVDYTPQIDRFASDSIVLKNAYTRYGGTALSEPAIWTGAMQLHKQYIEPYYPMNTLQKLLETDGYQSYISVDPILQVILHPSSSITKLDRDKSWSDLDFIPTLQELEAKIDARSDRKKPIFAYTQPQNVHTLTLERSRMKGGRKEVSIFELRRMDAAFGEFVGFLQQRSLYENSIIIVTSDHGDAYGEFGRWGHSDFLFPQVIRIPLIIHLPASMRGQLVWDAQQVAFTTDITPSLYYLLGHRPTVNSELFGRPLFTQTAQEASPYLRSHYLIVSSYAPVYAMLGGNGQSLFIADAVHSKSYDYNLADDPEGTRSHVTSRVRQENEALIRHDVELIDDFYCWHASSHER